MLIGIVFLGSRHGRAVKNCAFTLRHGGLLRQVKLKTLQGASAPVEASRGFSTKGGDESQKKQPIALRSVLGYLRKRLVDSHMVGILMKPMSLVCAMVGGLALSQSSWSASYVTDLSSQLKVNRISATGPLAGGCTAGLNQNLSLLPVAAVPGCSNAIAFDCNAETGVVTKAQAQAAFSQAQLALVTGKKVRLSVENEVKINGTCVATRVDVFRF